MGVLVRSVRLGPRPTPFVPTPRPQALWLQPRGFPPPLPPLLFFSSPLLPLVPLPPLYPHLSRTTTSHRHPEFFGRILLSPSHVFFIILLEIHNLEFCFLRWNKSTINYRIMICGLFFMPLEWIIAKVSRFSFDFFCQLYLRGHRRTAWGVRSGRRLLQAAHSVGRSSLKRPFQAWPARRA
jgi:hypothetical protein